MNCSKITRNIVGADCGSLTNGGTGGKAWLFNFADIDKSSSTQTGTSVADIVLNDSAKGYTFESLENTIEGIATLNVGTYYNTYDHQVTLRLFDDGDDVRDFMDKALDARIVAIVQKKSSDGYIFEVYGWESGLRMSESPYNTKYTDGVSFAPVFKTDADSKERHLPFTCEMSAEELDALCQTT